MRKLLLSTLRILDGTPRPTGERQRGQSLLELAFITPLLAIMVIGIVEIGWFANHYLIILEVTRIGARQGTVLTGDLSPLSWNNDASIHPFVHETVLGTVPAPADSVNYRDCDQIGRKAGFYNVIACSMLQSLDPLVMRGRQSTETAVVNKTVRDRAGNVIAVIPFPDDIIISVFALQAINNASPASIVFPDKQTDERGFTFANSLYMRTFDFETIAETIGKYDSGSQVVVVGRYPTNANECNVWQLTSGTLQDFGGDPDPFDYIENGIRDSNLGRFIELTGADTTAEVQRGFSWTAQHRLEVTREADNAQLLCWGSEWDNARIEEVMNLGNFVAGNDPLIDPWNQQRSFLPSQGIVLVEMYWMHDLLMDFPFMDTIVTFFGDPSNIVISVWAAFPVPAAEPNIVYGLP